MSVPYTLAKGAGAATTGAAKKPLDALLLPLTIAASLLGGLFGPSERTKKKRDIAMMEPYLNKFYMPSPGTMGNLNDVITKALLARMGRSGNWGWPTGTGGGMDTTIIDRLLSGRLN